MRDLLEELNTYTYAHTHTYTYIYSIYIKCVINGNRPPRHVLKSAVQCFPHVAVTEVITRVMQQLPSLST